MKKRCRFLILRAFQSEARGDPENHPGQAEFVSAVNLFRGPNGVPALAAAVCKTRWASNFESGPLSRGGAWITARLPVKYLPEVTRSG